MPASNSRGSACLALEPLKQIKQTYRAWRTYDEELLSGVVVAAIVAVAWSARSQPSTTQGQSTQQNASGTGGPSQPRVSGLAGSKSGPTVTRSGTTGPKQPGASRGSEQGSRTPRQQIRADGQTVGCQVSGPALETGSARNLGRRKAEPAAATSALCWSMVARPGSQPCRCRAGARRLTKRMPPAATTRRQ